jgi:hypothetical protein
MGYFPMSIEAAIKSDDILIVWSSSSGLVGKAAKNIMRKNIPKIFAIFFISQPYGG